MPPPADGVPPPPSSPLPARRDPTSTGLPAFEGKTTLAQGAGAIEALILATDAIADAATQIAHVARRVVHGGSAPFAGPFLVLAGDEQLDFAMAAATRAEIAAFAAIFARWLPGARKRAAPASARAGAAAALSAVAGLLRTETQVTGVDHTAISDRVLATAVAGCLVGRAILPGAVAAGSLAGGLCGKLMELARRRDALAAAADAKPSDEGAALKAALLRFDSFYARVTTPDAGGKVALVQAARLEQLLDQNALVLRIHVEKAGGSLINRTNLWTFLGFDPVRVSGGLVASFTITDPASGRVLAAAVVSSRTALESLRRIQAGAPLQDRGPAAVGPDLQGAAGRRDGRHAAPAARALGSRVRLTGGAAMADYYLIAGEAIEAVLASYDYDVNDWTNSVPAERWGIDFELWDQMLQDFRAEFNGRVAPCRLKAGTNLDAYLNKQLYHFQEKLSSSVVCPGEVGFDD